MTRFLKVIALACFISTVGVTAKNLPLSNQYVRTYETFVPKITTSFEILKISNDPIVAETGIDAVAIAIDYVAEKTKTDKSNIKISSYHTSQHNGVTHVYLQQIIDGVEVVNGVANVNVLKTGRVHSFGNSFSNGTAPPPSNQKPKYSATDAITALATKLNIKTPQNIVEYAPYAKDGESTYKVTISGVDFSNKDVPAGLKYFQSDDGQLKLVWELEVDMDNNYYDAFVDANTNNVVSLIDFISDATYIVLPFGAIDASTGARQIVKDPENLEASPLGWHSHGSYGQHENYTVTIGNNVYAQENLDGDHDYISNHRPDGEEHLVFNHKFDLRKSPIDNLNASITQLFYMNNIIHDVFYMYGFTELAGNFQDYNFQLGAESGDAVIANAQDGAGINNANMLTLPDGSNGRMRMYVWDRSTPNRDGVFDTGIVVHEYLHGISNRLTGGRNNVRCLPGGTSESGGMGEGWGDIYSVIFQMDVDTTRTADYAMATFSINTPKGIRKFPYSTNLEVNPSTYAYVLNKTYEAVHAKGEVWAVILYEVYWNIVEKHGFDPDWYNTNVTKAGKLGGNVLFAQLVLDGMKLQPCQPNFIQARDAIIEADMILNKGDNWVELWKGFAKRGLGSDAKFPGVDGFVVPPKPVDGSDEDEGGDNTTPSGASSVSFYSLLLVSVSAIYTIM